MGLVGCGVMAERHLSAYQKIKDAQVKAVCDINAEVSQRVGQKYNVSNYNDYRDVVENEKIDVVDVCTPTLYHDPVVMSALKNDKHIFCEKPLSYNVDNVINIKNELEKTNRILMTGYLYNFHPSFEMLKQILVDKIIGDPYFAIFRIGGRGDKTVWKHKKDTFGGSNHEIMVHMLDLACSHFSPIQDVQSIFYDTVLKKRVIDGKEVEADAEDCVYLRMKSRSGVEILCEGDLITPSYMNYVEVHGTNGSFFGSILDYLPTIVYCKEPRGGYKKGNNIFNMPQVDLVQRELEYFMKIVNGGKKDPRYINNELEIINVISRLKKQNGLNA